jgi:hypothetical protein
VFQALHNAFSHLHLVSIRVQNLDMAEDAWQENVQSRRLLDIALSERRALKTMELPECIGCRG